MTLAFALAFGVLTVIGASAVMADATTPSIEQFGRVQIDLPADSGVEAVLITTPDASVIRLPTFMHQPARFIYNDRGWEELEAHGAAIRAARFTPILPGRHTWKALAAAGNTVTTGEFMCVSSSHPGYVRISSHDRRYFVTTDGKPFCAIGLNLCVVPSFDLPGGGEFKTSGRRGTLGIHEYERWFDKLQANGGNLVRLWCGVDYLDAQKEAMGDIDPLLANRLDAVVAAARLRGIRLKLCIDIFRDIGPSGSPFDRSFIDPATGQRPASMSEFLDSPRWRELWLKKIDHFAARYAGDPTVAVIEPWNEMNCVKAPWKKTLAWNAFMLSELKKRFPQQLVAESLGSFDGDGCVEPYAGMQALAPQEFDQVHRYLDQGAAYAVCHDPVAGTIDAIRRVAQAQRPVLLAETGAVNDNHTGLFRFARWDDRGIIFHDTTFPAFFAGAAGTGQEWFWDSYVDQKNLWGQYKALSDLIADVAIDREHFRSVDLSTQTFWCLALVGDEHTLLWLRHRGDTWQAALRSQQSLTALEDLRITLPKAGRLQKATACWPESLDAVSVKGTALLVPTLRAGLMLNIRHEH